MKPFSALVVVRQPAESVFATVRDRLPDLVDALDDVRAIVELERRDLDVSTIRVVNQWTAEQRIPEPLARAVGGGDVGWVDRAAYDGAALTCSWRIEPSVLSEHVVCRGTTSYEPAMAGRGTRVRVDGEFELAKGALGGIGRVLEGPISTFVEALITTMIPKNTRRMIEAAAALVAREGTGGVA